MLYFLYICLIKNKFIKVKKDKYCWYVKFIFFNSVLINLNFIFFFIELLYNVDKMDLLIKNLYKNLYEK